VKVEADEISEVVIILTDIAGRRVNTSTIESDGDTLPLDISCLHSD